MITMPETKANADELDLHWKDAEPDFGIASEGVLCKDINEIIERISTVKNTVKKINLNNQHTLTEIPSVLKECELLEDLNISHTEITVIPGFLLELPNLRSLSCCCRKLSAAPAGIEKAKKLEKLHIRINEGWSFPEGITSLGELKTLAIDIYSDAAFPNDMGDLKKLEYLTLSIKYDTGAVRNLPASFSKHPALKNVNIGDHVFRNHKNFDLEKNAQILSSCSALESLTLSGFTVKKHKNLSLLTGLKELELRHLITEGNIFDSITTLKNLEKLDILGSEFKVTELPDIFGNFSQLRSFSFAGNFVPVLPPSLYKLDKLATLEIGSTGISALDENIGNLKNLEKIHVYDNLLEKLPDAIYGLPQLKLLNIEENVFRQQEIAAIKEKLNSSKNGNIEFLCERQGYRQFVKRLRALEQIDDMDTGDYQKHCLAAIHENPRAVKYANKTKLGSRLYAELCVAAVRKTCYALEDVDPSVLAKSHYFHICVEAAKSSEIAHVMKLTKDEFLTDVEYIQLCLEAALHNSYADFLSFINTKRMSREIYERICWVAILHYPPVFSEIKNPPEELRRFAEKRGLK